MRRRRHRYSLGETRLVSEAVRLEPSRRRRIFVMDQILPPELSDVELEALRQLAAHPVTRHLSVPHPIAAQGYRVRQGSLGRPYSD